MAPVEPWIRVGLTIDIASGVIFLILGLVVALVKPRRAINLFFALFATGFGLFYIFVNLVPLGISTAVSTWIAYAGMAMWTVGVIFVAARFPRPLHGRQRRQLRFPFIVYGAYLALQLALAIPYAVLNPEQLRAPDSPLDSDAVSLAFQSPAFGGMWLLLVALACRYASAQDGPERKGIVAVTWAVLSFLAVTTGVFLAQVIIGVELGPNQLPFATVGIGIEILMVLLVSFMWGRNAIRQTGHTRREAWLVACFGIPAILLGLGYAFATNVEHAPNLGLHGLVRLFGVAVLAYAILKQQLFDLDLRIKWGVSRGALVMMFLAVFFVVNQLIEAWAGQAFGSIFGAVAAGLLLFALHPLQKVAERIGSAAMPRVRSDDGAYILRRKRETYRNAVITAWGDGQLTPKDVQMLDQMRRVLGLPDKDILAIEREVAQAGTRKT